MGTPLNKITTSTKIVIVQITKFLKVCTVFSSIRKHQITQFPAVLKCTHLLGISYNKNKEKKNCLFDKQY